MYEHKWNSYSKQSGKFGATIPVLCQPALKRQHGATVVNDLVAGERVAAGTPMEFDLASRTAKLMKLWKIKNVEVSGNNTIVTLYRTATSPVLHKHTVLMVMPATLKGTGKAAVAGAVVEGEDVYTVTLATASFDALTVGGFLVEAKEAGSGKAPYCVPNHITTEDVIKGTENTLVDVMRGHVYMYQNTIPAMPEIVKEAMFNSDIQVSWELYNEE
jgi:hypothetical protein